MQRLVFLALVIGLGASIKIEGITTGLDTGDISEETKDLPRCTTKAAMPEDDNVRIHVSMPLPDCNPGKRVGQKPLSVFLQIGDYGYAPGIYTANVQELIEAMEQQFAMDNGFSDGFDFVFTTGDNAYNAGHCAEYIANNKAYERFFTHNDACTDPPIDHDITPLPFPENTRWFPTPGNHDWDTFMDFPFSLPYLQYWPWLLSLDPPGMKARGHFYKIIPNKDISLELFSLNSNLGQSGMSDESLALHQTQLAWVGKALAESTAEHRWVFFHHPPFCTAQSDALSHWMEVPWEALGATAVWNGHEHAYERMMRGLDRVSAGDFPYIVNGIGGNPTTYEIHNCTVQPGSQVRFNENHGAAVGLVYDDAIDICVYSVEDAGLLVDAFQLNGDQREEPGKIDEDDLPFLFEEETGPDNIASRDSHRTVMTMMWAIIIAMSVLIGSLGFLLVKEKMKPAARPQEPYQELTAAAVSGSEE